MSSDKEMKPGERIIVQIDSELKDLIPGFLENRRNDVNSMRRALESGDYETIRVLGHSMKGSGGGYGFDEITDIGSSLEQAAKNNESEKVRKGIGDLLTYLDHLEVRYE